MHIVLCDDDQAFLVQLEAYLRDYFDASCLPQPEYELFLSGQTLLDQAEKNSDWRPDIAFLDVEMPGISGIEIGVRLQRRNPYAKLFIVTSYADYLDEAMRFHVFRYLSKPLDKDRLFRNMKDALYQLSVDTRSILILTLEGTITRFTDEIVVAETMGRKVVLRAVDGEYVSLQSMKHWETLLETPSFYQTHRSFIVNMKYVRSISKTMVKLRAPEGKEYTAYLARRRYQDFRDRYMLYMEAMR